MNKSEVIKHYDMLIDEGNDPVQDSSELQAYMDKWDGTPFIKQLKLTGGEDVLEIGIGTGRIAKKIIHDCRTLTGIDISPKTIYKAKEHLKDANLICGDFLNYNFDCQFDLIYSSLTFLHFQDKRAIINKLGKIMRDKARAVISLTKDKSDLLTYGNKSLRLYPSYINNIERIIKEEELYISQKIELDKAIILIISKRKIDSRD
ncbi:class I SAM-dependent methyltransferase [Mycoplasmatota bacterium WC44]